MNHLTEKEFWDKRWRTQLDGREWMLGIRETDRLLSRVLGKVKQGGRILELGVAPGKMARRYFKVRPDLIVDGLDISDVGIQQARQVYERMGIKGHLYLVDFRNASSLEHHYDLVYSHGFVEHFDDLGDVVDYHFKFANNGGSIFITVPNYTHPFVKSLLHRYSHETVATHNFDSMSTMSLRNAVTQAGGVVMESGHYGGPTIPHSAVDVGLRGALYKRFCQMWNLSISIGALYTFDRLIPRLWKSNVYVLATKH